MLKELPVIDNSNPHNKGLNYLIMSFTAYKAAAAVIYYRFVTLSLVCYMIKPLITNQKETRNK